MKCENCKWFMDTTTSNENGTEYDGFCLIKGDDFYDCKMFPPVRDIIGWNRKRKYEYYYNHEYDGYEEYAQKSEAEENKLRDLISEYVLCNRNIYVKDYKGEFVKLSEIPLENIWRIRIEYEDFAHPFINKTLKWEWTEVIKHTAAKIAKPFKPYFCK